MKVVGPTSEGDRMTLVWAIGYRESGDHRIGIVLCGGDADCDMGLCGVHNWWEDGVEKLDCIVWGYRESVGP